MTARITYDSNNIDLTIAFDSLNLRFEQERNQNRAGSGKTETVNQYGIMVVSFTGLFDAATYRSLWAWWSWARQGKAFSFAVDSGDTASTTLDDSAAADQKVIPVTSTTGFVAGDYCLIRAKDNDDEYEVIEIASVSAGVSVTAEANLIYSYAADDVFRHWLYWPSMITEMDRFDPRRMDVDMYEAYFEFAENL